MPFPAVDRIEAERVSVVPVSAAHLDDLFAVNGDDEVTRFLPYASWRSPDDAQAWLARMEALAAAGTGRQFAVVERAHGRAIGGVLLFRHDEGSRRIELGYVLGRAHWRQGLMREAAAATCMHAFEHLGLRRIEAEVNPANTASCGLLTKLGFRHEGTLRQRWLARGAAYDTHLFGLLAGELQTAG